MPVGRVAPVVSLLLKDCSRFGLSVECRAPDEQAKAKPLKGIKVKPGTQWLKPGLVGRVRHLKGEQLLRHATLRFSSAASSGC